MTTAPKTIVATDPPRAEICPGSGGHVVVTPGQRRVEAGYVRPNAAVDVRCKECGRTFARTRISYTDHGIPISDGMALVPRHNGERK